MKTDAAELGKRLKQQRLAAGRTIASVAADAALSVPYIANLENGRGNPTLAALAAIAEALGTSLEVRLGDGGAEPVALPAALARFARTERFQGAVPDVAARERCLAAMAAMAAAAARVPSELDCHRLLDTFTLLLREGK